MTMVLLIWVLQLGALGYLALRDADLAGFLRRLKEICTNRGVWMLAGGCIAFIYAGSSAASRYDYTGATLGAVSFLLEFVMLAGLVLRLLFRRFGGERDLVFGSAEFATPEHAAQMGLIGETGIRLGTLRCKLLAGASPPPLHYTGERHLLTVAPTRAGKGVSTIIPNLLTYPGSVLVIDPKGENAVTTHERRSKIGRSFVIDPFGVTGLPASRFNPLDLLQPGCPTLIEDATLIAEAIVEKELDGNAKHFSEQGSDYISSEANCAAAVVYRNEFDAAGATVRARVALNRLLDAMPAQIVGLLDFDLGTYDRSVGGFPLGSLHGDGRLYPQPANRTAMGVFSEPPENVGNNLRWCGLDPFPRLRVQIRFIAPDVEWWGYLKMDETSARAFVAAHPGARKITVRFNDVVTRTRQPANGWRPDPAYVFELIGSIRNVTVSDWASHRPLPGTIVFR